MWHPTGNRLVTHSFDTHCIRQAGVSFLDKVRRKPVCGTSFWLLNSWQLSIIAAHFFFWLANREASHRCAMAFCLLGTEERGGGNWREGEIQLKHWNQDAWMDGQFHDGLIIRWVINGFCQKEDGIVEDGWKDGRMDGWMGGWVNGCKSGGRWKNEQNNEYFCKIVN